MNALTNKENPLILIVGVCASGKTTLSTGLRERGYNARSLAQEHSVSPRLWQRRSPDFLILLDCQYSTIKRRKKISWGIERYNEQKATLANAREHADLIVVTDGFTPEQLINHVEDILNKEGIFPSDRGEQHGSYT